MVHPIDLYSHRLLALKPSTIVWEFRGTNEPIRTERPPVMLSNDSLSLVAAAIAGNGLAMAWQCCQRMCAPPEIRPGHLVEVLVNYPSAEMWFKAFVSQKQRDTTPVRTFITWL